MIIIRPLVETDEGCPKVPATKTNNGDHFVPPREPSNILSLAQAKGLGRAIVRFHKMP